MASAFDGLGLGQLGAERNMKAPSLPEGDPGILGLILGHLLMPKDATQPSMAGNVANWLQTPKQNKPTLQGSVAPVANPVPVSPVASVSSVGVSPTAAPVTQNQSNAHPETDYVLKEFLGVK
jgi:hypothetical protein